MKTRCAVLHEPNSPFVVDTTDAARPATAEVMVEVLCCTICGSDLHTFTGRRPLAGSTILGHEIVGRVVDIGAGVTQDVQIGQRVTWSLCAGCGTCFYCTQGIPQKCQQVFKYGHEPRAKGPLGGGLASHCLLRPGTTILKVPDGLSDEIACPANCATATVMAAVRRAGDCRG
jgi:alcohol dehydrogenase